ncbi:hypothetical protein J1N35_016342 [Gossypium stocksii]|uniref:F-box/LRR-repeat protein 15/At3g58940/PEG3-like LRR domain-containing protein n=1 Tax=Gossypium stocksii TaxID=47602 RepID=A0A9D3VLH2_9ROSI|nr:hypothetical protein J1N35_016342 [Gossypium stocksii]
MKLTRHRVNQRVADLKTVSKKAVRTSIISTKWRNLFASISIIEFDGYLLRSLTDRNIDIFKNFADRLLKFPDQVSLDCFRLNDGISSWNDGDHDFDVSAWICAALCRGVKEIDLRLHNFGDVPPVLFTCQSLVNLALDAVGSKIEVPSYVCLGNLKTFYLRKSEFVGDSINRLILNCHALEDLAFIDCVVANASELNIQSPSLKKLTLSFISLDHVVVINAPNLVYFRYDSEIVGVHPLSNMKSLEKAELRIWFESSDYEIQYCDETSAAHLIQGICHVRCLVEFLHCAPNLKKLILKHPV